MHDSGEKTGDILLQTILVVDDDRMFRRTLELQLEHLGCRILQASNGPEGLELVARELPDLVLLDVVMPGMDGFEVCRRIKGDLDTHHITVIHLTALGRDAKERSYASGADDFLDKPINFLELRARIRTHLLIQGLLRERRKEGARPAPVEWEEGRPSRILVAEGHPQLRAHIVEELGAVGYDVKGVDSLKACLNALGGGLPDLLIVDRDMPDGLGTAFAAHLHSHRRAEDLPLLLICSHKVLQEQIALVDAGATDFLAKPFQPPELRIRVEVLLRHSQLLLGGGGHAGDRVLRDAPSGAWSRPFFEAHVEALCASAALRGLPVGLVAARLRGDAQGWGVHRDELAQAAHLLQAQLQPGEILARVADRTFAMALPGYGPLQVEARLEHMRQCGFDGVLAGIAGHGESGPVLLARLAEITKGTAARAFAG